MKNFFSASRYKLPMPQAQNNYMENFLNNKTILITGGTGSFGKKFVELVLKHHNPKVIRVFSRDECKQSEMQKQFKDERLRFFIGNIRDKERLKKACEGVDVLVHAAALKQVPSCEYNPFEAIKTNVLGTQNVIDAVIDCGIEKAIMIGTDKAVNPVNLYGATKLCAERLFTQANAYLGGKKTQLAVCRYGNVLASRGSVIPIFKEQKKQAVLTITSSEMTRFWITLDQAVNFVISCFEKMQGGEVFIPKIPSMRIMDLAKAIAPESKIKIIGIRPGEKLNEMLITTEEASHTREFDNCFIVLPQCYFHQRKDIGGKKLADGFSFSSDNNKRWLSIEELKEFTENL